MVGTHDDALPALLLNLQEGLHHLIHRYVALQVVRLVEVALGIALRAAQMDKVYAVPETAHHVGQVVLRAHAEGTRAQAESVGGTGHCIDERLEVVGRAQDAGQAQDGHGRVVGMDDQAYTCLFGRRTYLAQEIDEVLAQALGSDVLVAVQLLLELLQGEALLGTGQTGYHVAGNELYLGLVHLFEAGLGLGLLLGAVVLLGARTLQDEEVEGYEGSALEAQGTAPVGHFVSQIGARPVEHGHEVVGHHVYAALAQVDEALLVVVDVLLEFSRLCLDVLVYGHTLHSRPAEAGVFDRLLTLKDLFLGPYFAVGNVVQGGYNTCSTRLADILQADWVVGPIPAETLFTEKHRAYCLKVLYIEKASKPPSTTESTPVTKLLASLIR